MTKAEFYKTKAEFEAFLGNLEGAFPGFSFSIGEAEHDYGRRYDGRTLCVAVKKETAVPGVFHADLQVFTVELVAPAMRGNSAAEAIIVDILADTVIFAKFPTRMPSHLLRRRESAK